MSITNKDAHVVTDMNYDVQVVSQIGYDVVSITNQEVMYGMVCNLHVDSSIEYAQAV